MEETGLELKNVFDEHFSNVKFDRVLAKQFNKVRVEFVSKSSDHMEFFGGVLTGTVRVVFSSAEFTRINKTLLKLNIDKLQHDFGLCEGIVTSWAIAGDLFNYILLYCVHRWNISDLDDKTKRQAMIDTLLLFNYRTIAALMRNDFHFLVSKEVASAVFEQMSARFILKQTGSWNAYMLYRAETVFVDGYIHQNALQRFGPNQQVTYWVTDTQGRVKETLKEIYSILMQLTSIGSKVKTDSTLSENMEGDETISAKLHGSDNAIQHIIDIVGDKHSFVREDLVSVISEVVPTADPDSVAEVLSWISANYYTDIHNTVDSFVRQSLVYLFTYMDESLVRYEGNINIGSLLFIGKYALMSSKSVDAHLLESRTLGETLIRKVYPLKSAQFVSSARTAVVLYMFIRAITKDNS